MSGNCLNYKKYESFGIQQLARLNEDNCYKNLRTKTSKEPGSYQVSNFHECECAAPNTKDLSLEQPEVQYRDGYGWTSINGCNIDSDSKLRNARNLTNLNVIQQLYERPYLTVPFMGRGPGNTPVETKLIYGEDTFQNKPCNNLAGIYIDRFTPMIDCIKDNIQNTIHIIPEDNEKTWIRGGQPSRQIIRNTDYLMRCGFRFNGKQWLRP